MDLLITGGSGMLGKSILEELEFDAFNRVIIVDKDEKEITMLAQMYPTAEFVCSPVQDLKLETLRLDQVEGPLTCIICHAQIGGREKALFHLNNVSATARLLSQLEALKDVRIILISSSVVCSEAEDSYSVTKRAQEALVVQSDFKSLVLRPTLMYGPHDKQHIGMIYSLLKRYKVLPIPGRGKFLRQPLYAPDFAKIIVTSITKQNLTGAFNISGLEDLYFGDILRTIQKEKILFSALVPIPIGLFKLLVQASETILVKPIFTSDQFSALIIDERFEVIDWPSLFAIEPTSFEDGLGKTFV